MDVLFVSSNAQKHRFNNSIMLMLRDIDPQILITLHMIIFVMSLKNRKLFIVHIGMANSGNSMDYLVADSESDD